VKSNKNVTEHVLDNGLRVLLKEMHNAPIVSSWIWYRVGSRLERPGITGISHWVEHMMFKGTKRWDKGRIFRTVNAHGGYLNGFTAEDMTTYLETLPAEHAEIALDIESDRMANSLFDPEETASERSVIISEREGLENNPEMCLYEAIRAAAFTVHPYHWQAIGYKCDLESMTRDDLYDYYSAHYTPANATLCMAGDFDKSAMRRKIEQYFGDIPRGSADSRIRAVEPAQQGEIRLELQKPGNSTYLIVGHHGPEFGHEDMFPLMLLDAVFTGAKSLSLMGGIELDRSSRLCDLLIDKKQVAVDVRSMFPLNVDPTLWTIHVMLRDGASPKRAEKLLLDEIDKIADKGPTAKEMKKALNQTRAQIEYSRDGVTNNAFILGYFDTLGDYKLTDNIIERISQVTREDVMRVARKYFARKNRVVGVFLPEEAGSAAPHAEFAPVAARPFNAFFFSGGQRYPELREHRFENGVRLIGVENMEANATAVGASIRVGAKDDPPDKKGLSSMAASMLDEGTEKHNYRRIAEKLESVGSTVEFKSGIETTGFGSICLKKHLPTVLATAAECLTESIAPEDELEKVKAQTVTALRARQDSPLDVAKFEFMEALYPEGNPYHWDPMGSADSVAGISRDDVLEFMRRNYGPQGMTVAVAGPVEFERVIQIVGKVFSGWRSPSMQHSQASWQEANVYENPHRIDHNMTGKSQCEIIVGRLGITRKNPDKAAVQVANSIFGRFGLMGRIGSHARDELGLAYHAYSSVSLSLRTGNWVIVAGVNPRNIDKALAAIEAETERICSELVSDEELADTKGNLLGSLPLKIETSQSLASLAHDIGFYELELDYLEKAEEKIKGVTKQQVLEVARKYLRQNPVICVAGPLE